MANSRCSVEGFSSYEIEFLSEAACKELFYAHYRGKSDAEEEKDVDALIRRAGYHTLAVELLARTAGAAGLGVKDLNLKLDQVGFDLDRVIKENIQIQWQNDNVKRTFFQHLAKVFDLSRLAEEEKLILCNISVMPALPLEIVDLKEWLGLESADVLNGLVEKGWLKRIGNRVEMHAVIGEVVRIKEKPGAAKCSKLIESLQWVFHVDPGDNPLEKRDYVVIGESVAQRLDDNDQYLAALANNLSTIYQALGQPERALEFQEKALKIREAVLDKNHPELARSYYNLSMIYLSIGKFEEVLEYHEKALRIIEKSLPENHPLAADSYINFSLILKSIGRLDEALDYGKKGVEILKKLLPEDNTRLKSAADYVGLIRSILGK